jgi:hypothetical protein
MTKGKKELKSRHISIRIKPSTLKKLRRRKINCSKLFQDAAEIKLKSSIKGKFKRL